VNDIDEDDGEIISDWPESPSRNPSVQVIDVDDLPTNIGVKRQREAMERDSSPVRPAQRPRLQLKKDRLMKCTWITYGCDMDVVSDLLTAQIEHYSWAKLKDYLLHTNSPRAELENMPATCRILCDMFFLCLKMSDSIDAQYAIGSVKIMAAKYQRQPPLKKLQEMIKEFVRLEVREIMDMGLVAATLAGTKFMMTKVPLQRRNDLYEGILLEEWEEVLAAKEASKSENKFCD
jgi:hypothetical protein